MVLTAAWKTNTVPHQICQKSFERYSFPGGSDGKESTHNAGDLGSIPELGRSPGGGHDNPLQYSCLENPGGPQEPGRVRSMELQRIGHDWMTKHKHIHNMQCIILIIYKCAIHGIKYILNVVQPSPLSSPRTFSSSQIKTPLISCSPFPSNYFFLFSCHLQSAQQHITGLHVSWVTDVIGWWTPRLCLCMHNILGRIICKFIASRAASAWNIKPVN